MKRMAMLVLTVAVLAAVIACSGNDPTGAGSGNVQVLLTDAPLDLSTVSAVNVTITEFVLYPVDDEDPMAEGTGIVMVMPGEGAETLNLLDYQNGATTLVAGADAPEGDYAKIRMIVSAAELVHDHDGDPDTPDIAEPIKVPSGKVQIPVPFHLAAGEGMEITLDFDAERSVQVNSTSSDNHPYILRPVVTPVGVRSM